MRIPVFIAGQPASHPAVRFSRRLLWPWYGTDRPCILAIFQHKRYILDLFKSGSRSSSISY